MQKYDSLSLFILLIIMLIPFNQNLIAQVPATDSLALAAIYNTMGGDTWTDNTNWLNGSVDTWNGVTVSNGRVKELDLNSNNLQNSIPAEIGNLTALEKLNLGNNPINGPIPPEIGSLVNLNYLGLYMTGITGSIPSEIGYLINLERFQMNSCQIDGPIPAEIGNLINLSELNFTKNNLSGNIPVEIGNLVSLQKLFLYENQLTGSIPVEIGNLDSLKIINLSDNLLNGSIPPELSDLSNLTFLQLSENQLTGSIPAQLGELVSLTTLSLDNNQLSGSIPESIGSLVNLTFLGIQSNQINGMIPAQIGGLINLVILYAFDNQLTGTLPPEIGTLKNLERFYFHNNELSGIIPSEICNLENLDRLYLHGNQFDELPPLDSLTALVTLNISDNKFTFEDIEPNIAIPSGTFIYSPQDSIGSYIDTMLQEGDDLLLSVEVGGSANNYQWLRNETEIPGAVNSFYEITLAGAEDIGSYVCQITNTLAADLTLHSKAANVSVEGITAVDHISIEIPKTMRLYQNYPNPFNPTTSISFTLPEASVVKISVYNIIGEKVVELLDHQMPEGHHSINFDGTNFTSGIYFYRLQTNNTTLTKKMMQLK